MSLHRPCRTPALALACLVASSGWAFAQQLDLPAPPKASLLSLTLIPGGSSQPPGDRLLAAVLVYPGVEKVALALEAELVEQAAPPAPGSAPTSPPKPLPVPVKGQAHRGLDGRFFLEDTATAKEGGGVIEVSMIVPHAELDLVPKRGLLRYVLRGKVAGADAFETSTRLIEFPAVPGPSLVEVPPAPPIPPAEVLDPNVSPVVNDATRAGPTPAGPSGTLPAGRVEIPITITPPVPGKGLNYAVAAPRAPAKVLPTPVAPTKVVPAAQAPSKVLPDPMAPAAPLPSSFTILRKRPVLFATNRTVRAAGGTPSQRFGDTVGGLSYGTCLVNIPTDNHIQGNLELPGWFTGNDPDKYFLIETTNLLADRSVFRDLVRGAETRGDVLVYVHGFNTSFDFAVMRLAQIVHDIKFPGVPVAFSWPSHASAFDYGGDEANAMSSVDALADTLLALIAAQDARPEARRGKIHVIAHSLGNRLTLRALDKLNDDPRLAAGRKPFGQIILAAPDVSVAEFVGRLPSARARADRVSLYFCPDDEALRASEVRHPGEPRAGRGVVPVAGLDNIDARKANTSFLGHGYYAEVKQMLIDLQLLINLGWGPDQRNVTLDQMTLTKPPDYFFWAFR